MSRTSRDPSPDSMVADAAIHLLAAQLLDGLVADELEPSLIHVSLVDEEPQIGLLPLDGRHPTDLLIGFTAPADWHALGMVTSGWAFPVGDRAETDRRRTRVHVVTVLTRSGEIAHRTEVVDDPGLSAALELDAPAGEQIDLLRRALGLPTDEPPCGAEVYWTVEWLSAVLAADEIDSWVDVTDAHPAMRLLAADDDLRSDDFVDVVAGFGRVVDWSRLRRLSADGRFRTLGLTPTEAAWLDDGSMARYLLNRCPPLAMLRRQAIEHLPGHLGQRLVETLDQLGIPRVAWPDDMARRAA